MIIFITYENYPNGSPGSIRIDSFAKAYIQMGYEVAVIHKGSYASENSPRVFSLYHRNRFIKLIRFDKKVKDKLCQIACNNHIEAVISYGYSNRGVRKWCRNNDIVYVCDVVEWYSKEQFSTLIGRFSYWSKNRTNRLIAKQRINTIAISSYLADYFKQNGCKTVRIPIVHNGEVNTNYTDRDFYDKIRIVYAGSHLRMDNIPLIIKSFSLLTESEMNKFSFTIYGLTEDAVYKELDRDVIVKTKGIVHILGKRSNTEVIETLKSSDFTILLRNPNLRVNKAGFPSKVVESMRLGVPVICNYSSDLELYLSMENSVIVEELNEQSLVKSLRTILSMTSSKFSELRKNTVETVGKEFHAKQYKTQFLEIIQKN